jgi:hypothetical protein
VLVVLALGVALRAVQAAPAQADEYDRAFVEWAVEPPDLVTGQVFEVVLRVGLERTWPTWLQPIVARPLDLPVRVEARSFAALPGVAERPPAIAEGALATFALGDEVVHGVRRRLERGGTVFDVVEVRRPRRTLQPGDVVLEAPRLHLREAQGWRETLLGTRVAATVREVVVDGGRLVVGVGDPPRQGRPAEYVDAVGTFTLEASLEPLAGADRLVRLRLALRGEGNLAGLTPPGTRGIAGFHIVGQLDALEGDVRRVTIDLLATDPAVTRVPALVLASYAPPPGAGFVTVSTPPLPLPEGTRAPAAPPPAPGAPAKGSWRWLLSVLYVLLGIAGTIGCAMQVARRRRRSDPLQRPARLHVARAALDAAVAQGSPQVGERYVAWLAALLGTTEAAVVDAGLAARLTAAGVPADLAAEAATTAEAFLAARYGGAPAALAPRLFADLQVAFATRPGAS